MSTRTEKLNESMEYVDPEIDTEMLSNLLLEALETEKGGMLRYETAFRCVINIDLKNEWQKYLEQTRTHVETLTEVIEQMGFDVETLGQKVVRQVGQALVATKEIAIAEGEPETTPIGGRMRGTGGNKGPSQLGTHQSRMQVSFGGCTGNAAGSL